MTHMRQWRTPQDDVFHDPSSARANCAPGRIRTRKAQGQWARLNTVRMRRLPKESLSQKKGSSRNAGDAQDGEAQSLRRVDVAAQSLRCPPSLLRHVLRVSYRKVRCADHVLIGLRPLHLCGTRLEGGHRRLSPTLRFVWVEPTEQRRFGCWLFAIAKRSIPARRSRSSARSGAAARKGLTKPECS
jgi:hypothetical protein